MLLILVVAFPPFFFLFLDLNGIFPVVVLEGQLAASYREVEEARLQGSLPNEDRHRVVVPRTRQGAGASG